MEMMPFADVQKYLPAPPGDGPLAAEDTVAGEHQGLLPPAPISQSISSCKTAEGSLTPSETAQQMLKNPQIQNENPENAVTVPLLRVSRAVRSQVTYQDDVEADGRHWFRRLQQYSCLIYWVFMLMFAIFLCYYFYEILIAREPRLGKLEPQPGNTNLIVAVLCQVFGALMLWLYLDLFNALQLQLLSRPKGVLLLEAEQLSQSTGLFGTLQMCLIPGRHRKWTLQRIALPLVVLLLGNVLKIGAGITYEITTYGQIMRVWAGLAEMNAVVLNLIPTSVMAIYFLAWTPSLLDVPQFVLTLPPPKNCTNECAMYSLPGGIALVRLWGNDLNKTLLDQGYFDQADALQILEAPGTVIEFTQPIENVLFQDEDCELYGPIRGDAIRICIKAAEAGGATVIGWQICPTVNYNYNVNSTCMSDLTWTGTLGQVTSVSTYRQFTTTSYYRQNLSIIDVTPIGPQKLQPINVDAFKAIWAMLFGQSSTSPSISDPGSNIDLSDDTVMIDSFMFELGWYLRLYEDQFPDDHQSPIKILQNFITVPIQFYTTALQYWNATGEDGGITMPDEMQTTASAAHGRWRWKAPLSSVILWTVVGGTLIVASATMLFWILFQDAALVKSTAFPGMDTVSVAGVGCQINDSRITLADMAHTLDLANKDTRGMIAAFRRKRGYLIQARCKTHGTTHLVFVISKEEI